MRLKRVAVGKYKNLVNFECAFSESNISAFIGNNGSGKSNLLEVITEVFSFAKNYTAKTPDFTVCPDIYECEIEYVLDGKEYTLMYTKSEVSMSCNGEKLIKEDMAKVLPESILIYYAGETQRQAITCKRTIDERYNSDLKKASNNTFPGYKFMDYYSTEDLSLLLLTAAIYQGDYYEKLLNLLECEQVLPGASMILQNPKGKAGSADTYWNARGFVKSFLDEIRRYVSKTQDLSSKYIMHFSDISVLKNTSKNEMEFFTKLKALKNAGFLDQILVELAKTEGDIFHYDHLSEGEKQLSLLFLLATFSAEDNCLYLFDEFDAYLHPNWQREFTKLLRDTSIKGHLLFTTHSPLTLSKMEREEIQLLRDGEVFEPSCDTFNRDISDIFAELMDVPGRSPEVEDMIKRFKQAAYFRKSEKAHGFYEQLKRVLSDEDPFWLRANTLMEGLD